MKSSNETLEKVGDNIYVIMAYSLNNVQYHLLTEAGLKQYASALKAVENYEKLAEIVKYQREWGEETENLQRKSTVQENLLK